MASDLKIYLRQLSRAGYDVELTKSCHYLISYDGKVITSTGSTPGKRKRSLENLKAHIARFEKDNASELHDRP